MSLEQRMEELTAAVKALTAVIGKVQMPSAPEAGVPHAQVQWKMENVVPNANPEPQKSNDTSTTSDASLSESAPVSYEDVKKLVIELSKKDKEKAVAALARFGVKTAKDLAQDRWADFAAYVKDILAGGTDPEASHE